MSLATIISAHVGSYTIPAVYGCTNPAANNYNPSATVDDGSCTFDPTGPYDPSAQAYFDAVEAVPGIVAITDTQKQRYNDWVLAKKALGTYSSYKAVYPFFGGIEAAHKINAIDLSLGTFVGTWIHSTSGAKPNGTNAYFRTGVNPKTAMGSSTIFQMGLYTRTDIQTDTFDLGAATAGHQTMLLTSINGALGRIGSDALQALEGSFTDSLGYTVVRRSSATSLIVAKNGAIVNTNTTSNSADLPNAEIFAGAYNNSGTAAGFSTRQICWIDLVGAAEGDTDLFNSNVLVEGIQDAFTRGVQ